jgi:hypothetical protein
MLPSRQMQGGDADTSARCWLLLLRQPGTKVRPQSGQPSAVALCAVPVALQKSRVQKDCLL